MTEIQHFPKGDKGKWTTFSDGKEAGHMINSRAGAKRFIIDHTEVGDAFGGMGTGKMLVMETVAYARANQLKIMPLCPFAKSIFDKNVDLHDVKM